MPTVLITGANRGIGFEFARQYADEGWTVIGTVREPQAGAKLAALGRNVSVHVADVTKPATLKRLAGDLKDAPVDVLICNAGIRGQSDGAIGKIDYAVGEEVFRVNVLGAMATAEALADNVARSQRKIIVTITSGMGSLGGNHGREFLYAASKAAVNHLTVSLAVALKDRGITVAALAPGWLRTDMGGPTAPGAVDVAVTGLRRAIEDLTLAKSGTCINADGKTVPW